MPSRTIKYPNCIQSLLSILIEPISRGIAELPEGTETNNSIEPVPAQEVTNIEEGDAEYYIANYTYISQEPGDLTFNAGEVVTVLKKDGDWWTGKLKNNVGIFPSNYVQKLDVVSSLILMFLKVIKYRVYVCTNYFICV